LELTTPIQTPMSPSQNDCAGPNRLFERLRTA